LFKEVDGVRIYFVYSDEGLVGEFDESGVELRGYGLFLNDHLGTPQKIIDSEGNVVWEGVYESFGKARVLVSVVESNLRLAGQYFDVETGLHYNFHRFYDPETGRYFRVDPVGFDGGLNLYAYVGGNPLTRTDPQGLFFGNPTEWAVAIEAVSTATGIAASTVAATMAGVGAALYPTPMGDGTLNGANPNERPWRDKKGRWKVYVRCNVQSFENCTTNCPKTIGGWGYGKTFGEANANAQHDANENLSSPSAEGCYKRHCDPVACFENGKPVRCPRSGRTQR